MDLTRKNYQRNATWNTPYTYSGKEKDIEIDCSYFGARVHAKVNNIALGNKGRNNIKSKLFFLFFYISVIAVFSQNNEKYCFCESTTFNGEIISPKDHAVKVIKDTNKININKTGDIWSNIVNSNFIKERDENRQIPISIDSSFILCKIIEITKKNDNYILKEKRLIRKPIYLIDAICYNEDSVKSQTQMRIISVQNDHAKKDGIKIKKGNIYKLFLISYFENDCCKTTIDNKIVDIVMGPATKDCFFLNRIWIVHLDLYYNWYKTPNLEGLFYSP